MTDLPAAWPDSALKRLFQRRLEAGDVAVFSLSGGSPLFLVGEPADQLYLLLTGRLAASRPGPGPTPQRLGLIRPGEPAGEMSLMSAMPHTADVIALRDCEILALPRALFLEDAETDPALMIELSRLLLARAHRPGATNVLNAARVFGFIAACDGPAVRPQVQAIADAVARLGHAIKVVGVEAREAATEWFSEIEQSHEYVFYVVEWREVAWRGLAARQADRLFLVGRGGDPPPPDGANPAHLGQRPIDLILLQSADCAIPRGSDLWTTAFRPGGLLQLREGHRGDLERLARVITGRAVSLVLSGGAARGYAHVGAIRALREWGTPIDFVAGVSMGAVIGAGLCMGWDEVELDWRIRKAFVETSALDDIAFPLIALTRGEKVRTRLQEHFGNRQICDLWLPFVCGSANLTTGVYHLHRQGLVRDATRASLSLPGVLPPVIEGADVLVDGAVMNNFPADIVRTMHAGPIVGVDVTRGRSITAEDVSASRSAWRWLLSGEWRNGPPIVSLLMRAATVTAGRDHLLAQEAADLLVLPKADFIEIRDWKAYEPAVREGYRATMEALQALDRPVTELTREGVGGAAISSAMSTSGETP